jgi:hypothetical protein
MMMRMRWREVRCRSDEEMSEERMKKGISRNERVRWSTCSPISSEMPRWSRQSDRCLVLNMSMGMGSSGEMALAHLLHGSAVASRPLTRRVWNTLTQRGYFASSSRTDHDNLSFGDQQALELMMIVITEVPRKGIGRRVFNIFAWFVCLSRGRLSVGLAGTQQLFDKRLLY